jgi:pimeloyl-ACP methyl ester carboxylesterase
MIETMRVGELTVMHDVPARSARPPVLFVHGYFAGAAVWTEWLPFFAARGFPAYAVNLRGRAGSGSKVDLGRVSIDDYVADAAAVARHIGAHVIVGHSMGGLITQRLAADGVARAAVLITPAPPRGILVLTPRVAMKQIKYLPSILRSRTVTPKREDLREIVLNRVPAAMQNFMLDAMVPDSGRAGRDMSVTGVPVDAASVKCPMLVVTADDDLFIPRAIAERVAKRYGAPVQTMIGHGHMMINEPGWEVVADLVARWAESV